MASTIYEYMKQAVTARPLGKGWRLSEDLPQSRIPAPANSNTPLPPAAPDAALWNDDIGTLLAEMLAMAGYPASSIALHTQFFRTSVAPLLGFHPQRSEMPHVWKSFMTDDHTPVELSWCWSAAKDTPAVRYSVEPIGRSTSTGIDPTNLSAGARLLGETLSMAPDLDLYLHRHFRDALLSAGTVWKRGARPEVTQSQCFIAFDLIRDRMVVKQYYLPSRRALEANMSNWQVAKAAVQSLSGPAASLLDAFGVLIQFIESFSPDAQPAVEIVAIDCLDPATSRLKIYVRSRETSFRSALAMLSLGGRVPLSDEDQDALRQLWLAVFGLRSDIYHDDDELPTRSHRTSGILYYFELKGNARFPKSKVYLPVRHYAQDDDQIARGLSAYLDQRGKRMATGSYYDAAQKICKHRRLVDALGFHTYVSWACDGGTWNVTADSISNNLITVCIPVSGQLLLGPPWKFVDGQGIAKFLRGHEVSKLWQQYGPVYRIWSGLVPEIVLTTPEDVKMFHSDSPSHCKSRSSNGGALFHDLLGDCMGLINGERWKRVRAAFLPYFMHRAVMEMTPQLETAATEFIQQLTTDDECSISAQKIARFPFMTTAEYIYGPLTEAEKESLWSLGQRSLALMGTVLSGGIYRFGLYRFLRPSKYWALKEFEDDWTRFNEQMYHSRGESDPIVHIWKSLQEAGCSQKEMVQTMSEILFANLDVATHVLGWFLIFVGQDAKIQTELRDEMKRVSVEELLSQKDSLLHFCFLESLRLRPFTVFTIPEYSPQAKVYNEKTIRAKISVVVDTLALNHGPFWGDKSLEFDPYRMRQLSPTEMRYNLFTFGFGSRKCLGQYFAEAMMKHFLVALLQRFDMTLADSERYKGLDEQAGSDTWVPISGLQITLRRRSVHSLIV